MSQRARYWSCTKFANWVRGTDKPGAQTSEGWYKWNTLAKKNHAIRYWIAEEALDGIQSFLYKPTDALYSVKYYINNRWVTKTHALTAHPVNLPRGQWRDVGDRFLPCLFNELVNFVEVEQAWHNIVCDREAHAKYNPPFWATGWFRWRIWRCPQAGLEHLQWAANLKMDEDWVDKNDPDYGKPTLQALAAQEIMALYHWWKDIYPNRKDPHNLSGWSDFCARRRAKIIEQYPNAGSSMFFGFERDTAEEQEESRRILALSTKIEQEQKDEDTEMLTRLIKVRDHLWT